ncbi:hypothetical protein ANN_17222 [Periplaneta americana]|uniref:Uncharacterized protein n=1 Tax=Periplaneta americana TaxID=6978 RepID=A0ABQ8STR2_PERAM|nr:hypothetical protein ANN_17222 [Periplaneta americana]
MQTLHRREPEIWELGKKTQQALDVAVQSTVRRQITEKTENHAMRELVAKSLPPFYEVYQEVHCLAKDGSSRRVDIIAINRGNDTAIIIDPTVRFETAVEQPIAVHEEKKIIYDPTIQYFRTRTD